MKILVFNAGSSSLKFKLFEAEEIVPALGERLLPEGKSLLKGMVENIGTEKPMMMIMIAVTTSNSTNVNPDTLRIL